MSETELEHEMVDGFLHLRGALNENGDLSFLLSCQPPLRLHLAKLNIITSIGCRKWLAFLDEWGARGLELHACPPPFVGLLNMVPAALGTTRRRENVRSVMIPSSCSTCGLYLESEVAMSSLKQVGKEVLTPDLDCPSCGAELRQLADPEDFFVFWTQAAGKPGKA